MQAWQREVLDLGGRLLGRPRGCVEAGVLAAVALVALVAVLKTVTSASRVDQGGWTRQLAAALAGLSVAFFAAVGASLYIAPRIQSDILQMAAVIGTPMVCVLAVAVPLQRLILRAPYVETLLAFTGGLVACAVSILALSAIFDSVRGGRLEFTRVHDRTVAVDSFLNH